jgi:hypothetical protein
VGVVFVVVDAVLFRGGAEDADEPSVNYLGVAGVVLARALLRVHLDAESSDAAEDVREGNQDVEEAALHVDDEQREGTPPRPSDAGWSGRASGPARVLSQRPTSASPPSTGGRPSGCWRSRRSRSPCACRAGLLIGRRGRKA